MDRPNRYNTLRQRFPEWSELIGQQSQQDPGFGEACSDYEELAGWLADPGHDACPPESPCAVNRLLLAELEIEILHYLQGIDRQTGHQS